MRVILAFIFALNACFLFASHKDSFSLNFRELDRPVKPYRTVDSTIQFVVVEPEDVLNRSDEWVNGPLNSGPGGIGSNYDSIHNINPKVAGFIAVCFLSFVLYIIFRVRRSLKKDKRKNRR